MPIMFFFMPGVTPSPFFASFALWLSTNWINITFCQWFSIWLFQKADYAKIKCGIVLWNPRFWLTLDTALYLPLWLNKPTNGFWKTTKAVVIGKWTCFWFMRQGQPTHASAQGDWQVPCAKIESACGFQRAMSCVVQSMPLHIRGTGSFNLRFQREDRICAHAVVMICRDLQAASMVRKRDSTHKHNGCDWLRQIKILHA